MSKFELLLACTLGITVAGCGVLPARWVEQGPGITLNGQVEGLPGNPVVGGMNAIAVDRTRPGTVYVGTINGGVWKSIDANSASPNWRQLTDLKLPGLSINSIAISPLDSSTIFAGTGSTSAYFMDGSPGFGVIRSTDGGATWDILASSTFTDRRINSIVPTTITSGGLAGQLVLAATLFDRGGVYRSLDGGETFTRISDSGGLPDAGVSSLVADPSDNRRLYAAVPADFGGGTAAGIYRSDNGGIIWTPVNNGLAGLPTSQRILLSVGRNTGVVYAMVIAAGRLTGVFRTANGGGTWTAMGVPTPNIHPGGQGIIHAAIEADPVDPNIVFIGGDRQDGPFPNVNGCRQFSAVIYRGNAALASPWQNAVCNGAQGTSPHADSRDMEFDTNGNMLQGDDGGIYRLINPNAATRQWVSLNTNIRPTEVHSAAYDAVSRTVFGGTQDTGTVMQNAPGSRTFTDFLVGDGGVVAVDDTSAPGVSSLRYTSFFSLANFNRSTWSPSNTLLSGPTPVGLRIVSGPGTGQTLHMFDNTIQFYNPYVLNRINPSRMLIGTTRIYESGDRGDTLANLFSAGKRISSLSYGGSLNGVANPDAFYVGTSGPARPLILHRATAGGAITELTAYPGGGVRDLVMDPQDTRHIYVLDEQNRVWASFDEGATWRELTANLATLLPSARTIELLSPAAGGTKILLVGGLRGVVQMRGPAAAGRTWKWLGKNLPRGLVLDVRYNYTANVLTAGILGRGIWTLRNLSKRGKFTWQSAETAITEAPSAQAPLALPADMPTAPPVAPGFGDSARPAAQAKQ